ncbi:MAG: glycine cleavage system aminomethyltransferase GcvT [Neisseriaceae bacterium]
MSELKKTALYQAHLHSGGKMVDFFGWSLPIHYGSQIAEHEAVRRDAGMFDVSHMMITDASGQQVEAWLSYLLCNDVKKLKLKGKALYSALLNERGGVIDDLIVYRLDEEKKQYRIVSNAATSNKVASHFKATAVDFSVELTPRSDLSMLAVQGPQAIAKLTQAKPDWLDTINALEIFQGASIGKYFVAKTGYTGEAGVEIILPSTAITELFEQLIKQGVQPCGLGARDTLRLEAGMNLYGQDMDETTTPLETGMGWTVSLSDERDFIGKAALLHAKQKGVDQKLVGLLLEGKGVLRQGMQVMVEGIGTGLITSGSFSPTLKSSIALARVPINTGDKATVLLRGATTQVKVVRPPFVRHGKSSFNTGKV